MNDLLDCPVRIEALSVRSVAPARRMIPVLEWTFDGETGRPVSRWVVYEVVRAADSLR